MRCPLAAIVWLAMAITASAEPELGPGPRSSNPIISSVEVGIEGCFKVGCWTPIRIKITNRVPEKLRVEVTVPDSDGVPTTASAPVQLAAASDKNSPSTLVYTKVGRIGSPIQVSLLNGDTLLDERTLSIQGKQQESSSAIALPASAELLVSMGTTRLGLASAFPPREAETSQLARRVVELNQLAPLPTDWFGYEAVDVLVISAGDGKLCRELAADPARFAALTRWVELGGRLVIFCGGNTARELFAEGGPLSRFAPGKLTEVVRLPKTGPLEHFASAAPISVSASAELRVPQFVNVAGNIEAYYGQQAKELPLVVRSPHGFGEVAFVGVDLSQPPLADWSGRAAFLQAVVRPYLANIGSGDASQRLVTRGYNDLSGALRQALGRSFASVVPIGFGVVAGLAIAYMVVLGPLDYLFINRWLRKPAVAWISFPLIVALFSAGAMVLADWREGTRRPRVNQIQLVDVDTISGRARGTFWSTLYSPVATQRDLSLQLASLRRDATDQPEILFSWWGLPGAGIGGMQAGGMDPGLVHTGYRYGDKKDSLSAVPVLASATKSFMARWTGPAAAMVEADLTDQDGLATGFVTNQMAAPLKNIRLFYGSWAYRLGTLKPGQRIAVGEQLSPRKVKTIVTRDALGESGPTEGRVFAPEQASPAELLNLMMFYDAAGGFGFAHLPHRYQLYCDLSRSLELGRAILIAESDKPVAQLIDTETEKAVGDEQDLSTVTYRFLFPIKQRAAP